MMRSIRFVRPLLAIAAVVSLVGCSTTLKITSTPFDADIALRNAITQEVFPLGQGHVEFKPKPEYGTTFTILASKKGFVPRDLSVTPAPGSSTNYYINLKAEPPKADVPDYAAKIDALLSDKLKDFSEKLKELESQMRDRLAAMMKEAQDRLREADEDRRLAMMDRMRAEMDKKNSDSEKKVKVLENTFEVYKDALFSERYAAGPARGDRRRIDNSVDFVTRIQQAIAQKQLPQAEQMVDKLLERDEYLAKGYALKGTVKYLLNKPGESIVAYERALELDPNDKATERQLASLYRATGRQPSSQTFNQQDSGPAAPPAAPAKPASLKVRDR